ncbi:MAG: alpha/beta hydrolase [Rhodocyclaceae bacterium]|nr:alpha/beta hydrolase [Rhodocyclaceae bacterium]
MTDNAEAVILIHGLWMHGVVFLPHHLWLEAEGFTVHRFSYPSWSQDLESNADRLATVVGQTPGTRIHLVGHSLGGLLALAMLEKHKAPRIGRIVLMGSPCAGCHCGSYLADRWALSPFLGSSMKDWLARPRPTQPESLDVGIIAGTRRWGLGRVIPGLPRPNDGVVAAEETCLPGARDRILLPVSHSGMLISPACARQVASFLRTGHFIHA